MPLREIFRSTEPSDLEAAQRRLALVQAMQQQAMQPRVPVQTGSVTPAYGAGNALVDLAGALASSYNVKKANDAYSRAKDAKSAELAKAIEGYRGAVPDQAEGAAALANLRASPEGELPQAVTTQSQARSDLAKAAGLDTQQQLAAALLSQSVKPAEDYTLSPGQVRYSGGKPVASLAAKPDEGTTERRNYLAAYPKDNYPGGFGQWLTDQKKSGATNVNVNTEKSLYGTMADAQAKQYSELYGAAQAAPEAIARSGRIRELLKTQPYTGTGAGYKLALGKGARALGFNFAQDDTANTEALASEMARSTLDMVKSSGLAGSQGLTEGERKFLMQAVAGEISLEPETINRLTDLNERTARNTLNRWNETAGRLDANQLKTLGMAPIAQPAPPTEGSPKGKLSQNPDGSYTYTP